MNLYTYDRKNVTFKPLKLKNYIISVVGIGLIFLSLGAGTTFKYIKEEIPVIYRTEEVKFSEKQLKLEIEAMHLPHKDILLCQAKLETGNFQSAIFKQNCNLFGMKFAPNRINLQKGEQLGFAKYDNFEQSLYDMSIYLSLYCKGLSDEEYLQFVNEVYAPNQEYASRLKQLLKQQKL